MTEEESTEGKEDTNDVLVSLKQVKEICDRIVKNAERIHVREKLYGKWGAYSLVEMPITIALKHAMRFVKEGHMPYIVTDDGEIEDAEGKKAPVMQALQPLLKPMDVSAVKNTANDARAVKDVADAIIKMITSDIEGTRRKEEKKEFMGIPYTTLSTEEIEEIEKQVYINPELIHCRECNSLLTLSETDPPVLTSGTCPKCPNMTYIVAVNAKAAFGPHALGQK